MSTSYSPNGTYPTFPLVLPADGELINEAVLVVGILEPLIDAVGLNCARTFSATQTFTKAPGYGLGALGDADGTIDVSKATWILAPAATVLRVATLRSTMAPIPTAGQRMRVRLEFGGAAAWRLVRESGVIVATLNFDANDPACADVYWNGAVWKLDMYSAHVTPGIGA